MIALRPHVHSVAAADMDGDGKVDLVFNDRAGSRVIWLRGRGDGSFAAPREYRTGQGPVGLASADVDGDGIADLAVCQPGGGVRLFLGGPSGLREGGTLAAATAAGVEVFLTR